MDHHGRPWRMRRDAIEAATLVTLRISSAPCSAIRQRQTRSIFSVRIASRFARSTSASLAWMTAGFFDPVPLPSALERQNQGEVGVPFCGPAMCQAPLYADACGPMTADAIQAIAGCWRPSRSGILVRLAARGPNPGRTYLPRQEHSFALLNSLYPPHPTSQ